MEILQAILLGIVEGFTEFLPVSSTGHLIVSAEYMDFKDSAEVFTVVVQMGAMSAVVWNYRKDLTTKTKNLFGGEAQAQKFWLNLAVATLPAMLIGYFAATSLDKIAEPKVVAGALIVGAFVLYWADSLKSAKKAPPEPKIDTIKPRQALIIGAVQCFALIPGTSRSGASIVGGLVGGLDKVTATAFSFYMGIPVLFMAGIYKLLADGDKINAVTGGWTSIVVGTIVSFIVALITIRWLLRYVSTHSFKIFVYYRILLGLIIIALLI